jgi:hypothetical protein
MQAALRDERGRGERDERQSERQMEKRAQYEQCDRADDHTQDCDRQYAGAPAALWRIGLAIERAVE